MRAGEIDESLRVVAKVRKVSDGGTERQVHKERVVMEEEKQRSDESNVTLTHGSGGRANFHINRQRVRMTSDKLKDLIAMRNAKIRAGADKKGKSKDGGAQENQRDMRELLMRAAESRRRATAARTVTIGDQGEDGEETESGDEDSDAEGQEENQVSGGGCVILEDGSRHVHFRDTDCVQSTIEGRMSERKTGEESKRSKGLWKRRTDGGNCQPSQDQEGLVITIDDSDDLYSNVEVVQMVI